MIRNKKYTN